MAGQFDCPICLSTLDSCVVTPCGHKFHSECLSSYFLAAPEPGGRARCPICRGSVHAPLPVEVSSTSGRAIEIVPVPPPGGRCHFDRRYIFHALGSFADVPGMLYVLTSNDDRHTPSSQVMWTVQADSPCTVHINFRSEEHVQRGNAEGCARAQRRTGGQPPPAPTALQNHFSVSTHRATDAGSWMPQYRHA